ncbi:MAG: DUF2059 domain-containing protein [Waddliaceae bacterium]
MKKIQSILSYGIFIIAMAATFNLMAGNSRQEAANELLEIMQFEKTMDDAVDGIVEMQMRACPEMAQFEEEFRTFFSKYLDAEHLKEYIVDLYVELFTEKELHELTAFYQTDLGQKMIHNLPRVMQRTSEIVQARIIKHIGELESLVETIMEKSQS